MAKKTFPNLLILVGVWIIISSVLKMFSVMSTGFIDPIYSVFLGVFTIVYGFSQKIKANKAEDNELKQKYENLKESHKDDPAALSTINAEQIKENVLSHLKDKIGIVALDRNLENEFGGAIGRYNDFLEDLNIDFNYPISEKDKINLTTVESLIELIQLRLANQH